MIYYFSTGNAIVGVALLTGLVTTNSNYTFADGEYFDLMRNFENCISANPLRLNPFTTKVDEQNEFVSVDIFPNPTTDFLILNSGSVIKQIEISTVEGRLIYKEHLNKTNTKIDLSEFINGIYFVKLTSADNKVFVKRMLKY